MIGTSEARAASTGKGENKAKPTNNHSNIQRPRVEYPNGYNYNTPYQGGFNNQRQAYGYAPPPAFAPQHRAIIRDYYHNQYASGQCPQGLMFNQGYCAPVGNYQPWAVGQPLPSGVPYYELPPQLISQIGAPPAGYRYVRVASDILMMAAGTGMIVDAISGFHR
jgi:hypothetical protein